MSQHFESLLTPNQVSKLFQVSTHTLYEWRRNNRGPRYVEVEGSIRYPREAVFSYLEKRTISPTGEAL